MINNKLKNCFSLYFGIFKFCFESSIIRKLFSVFFVCRGGGIHLAHLVPNEIFHHVYSGPFGDDTLGYCSGKCTKFLELKTDLVGPNSVDPEEIPQIAASLLDRHCLSLKILFWRSDGNRWVKLLYFEKKEDLQ